MRILIAGSSGFLGTPLTAALRDAGHEVRRLIRVQAHADRARQPGDYWWDPPTGRVEHGAFDGVDAVINLCGSPISMRWSAARKQIIIDSRVEPTDVLAEEVAEHGVSALINASGIHYYGETGDAVVDETSPAGTGFLAELCQRWEAATGPAVRAGARVVHLRTGIVLGAGGMLGPMAPLFRLGLGAQLGDGRQYLPWVSLRDDVAAIRFLTEHDSVSGPVNICAPEPVTNAEFTRTLAQVLHRPAPWRIPAAALRLALGEAADELALISLRAVPAVLRKAGFCGKDTKLDQALAAAL